MAYLFITYIYICSNESSYNLYIYYACTGHGIDIDMSRKWSAKVHVIWLSWRLHDWYEASVWGYWVASSYFYTLISFKWNLQRPLRLHVKTTLTLHLIRTSIIICPSPLAVYNVSVKTRLPTFFCKEMKFAVSWMHFKAIDIIFLKGNI